MKFKVIYLLLLMLIPFIGKSQDYKDDMGLVLQKPVLDVKELAYYKRPGNDLQIMETHRHSFFAVYNPLSLTLKSAMFIYQHVLSPQLSRSCPYEITCSNFSKQAIAQFGIVKGVLISADRIMRCNRIALLDINPLDVDEKTGTIIDPVKRY